MQWKLGQTIQKRELAVTVFAPTGKTPPSRPMAADWPWVLFLGGVHGDEVEGVWLMEELSRRWSEDFPARRVGALVMAQANPDGFAAGRRWNANEIDLNRNLPSRDWTPEIKNPRYPPGPPPASEPESEALVRLIEATRPRAILSAHSFGKYQVNVNGPAREWGERLAALCSYPVTEDIGYPTPGCLGTYAGKELGIPTVTLEIERGLAREEVLRVHLPVAVSALGFWEEK